MVAGGALRAPQLSPESLHEAVFIAHSLRPWQGRKTRCPGRLRLVGILIALPDLDLPCFVDGRDNVLGCLEDAHYGMRVHVATRLCYCLSDNVHLEQSAVLRARPDGSRLAGDAVQTTGRIDESHGRDFRVSVQHDGADTLARVRVPYPQVYRGRYGIPPANGKVVDRMTRCKLAFWRDVRRAPIRKSRIRHV